MQILGFYLQDCRARVSSTRPYSAVQKAQAGLVGRVVPLML